MVRMSKWLLKRGHRVTFLAGPMHPSLEFEHENLTLLNADGLFSALCSYHRARKAWRVLKGERPDVIKTFDLMASWIGTILSMHIRPRPKVIFGNYLPYIIPTTRNPFRYCTYRLMLYNLARSFCDKSYLHEARTDRGIPKALWKAPQS